MSILIQQNIVAGENTCNTGVGRHNMLFELPISILLQMLQQWHPPVEVPVDDGLSEIVQVLHAFGHVNGNDELGLQVDKPVHLHIIRAAVIKLDQCYPMFTQLLQHLE